MTACTLAVDTTPCRALTACGQRRLPWLPALYLHSQDPRWWQFVTAAFCHHSWDHLSSNLFMLYTFGKIVEEEEGSGAVWFTYVICALGEGHPEEARHLSGINPRQSLPAC